MRDCDACEVDHHGDCPWIDQDDDRARWEADQDGCYTVFCCCGRWSRQRQTTHAEYARYARDRQPWGQPGDGGAPS